ncbi:MAG: putative ring and ubiquitin domain containing protein, partial [Streblomastix strix]
MRILLRMGNIIAKKKEQINAVLKIQFVGDRSGEEIILPDTYEYMTLADAAQEVLSYIGGNAAKLSFVAESGSAIKLKVNQIGVEGDGQENKFIQELTGFMSTPLTCVVEANTKEGEVCVWMDEEKSQYVIVSLDSDDTFETMKEKIGKTSIGPIDIQNMRMSRRITENSNDSNQSRNSIQGAFERGEIYIQTGSAIRIIIKTSEERAIPLSVESWETVLGIKKKIDEEESVKPNRQKLVYNGIELQNEKKMIDYEIPQDSVIQLLVKERVAVQPNVYANVEGTDRIVKFEQGRVPQWRIVEPGLTIEGKCTNILCTAKGYAIICNLGFDDIDYQLNEFKCPICNSNIKPIKFAFNNCIWKIHFMKPSNSKGRPDTVLHSEWRRTGDKYFIYEKDLRMKDFKNIAIHTRDLSSG